MYINPNPNPSGAYGTPQSNAAPGLLYIPDELARELCQYNGFVTLAVEDGAVTAVTPDMEAWEAWKAALPPEPEPEAEAEYVTYDQLAAAIREGVNSLEQ